MIILDRKKIIDFMSKRKAVLDDHLIRDFSGGTWNRLAEQREVKYWKEAIERGEFDTEIPEVYVILSATHPEIVDFTFYITKEAVEDRVADLNKLAKKREYWYITLFSNARNSGKE